MNNLIYLVTLKPTSHRTAEESLSILYLGATLQEQGYVVKIRDSWLDEKCVFDDIVKEIINDKDRILFVGTSSYMLNNEPTIELIKQITKENINVASGGFGPTFEPEIFLNAGAKIVMIGEGEYSILKVCEYFNNNLSISEIPSVLYYYNGALTKSKSNSVCCDLDTLPFPLRPYISIVKKRRSTINVSSSRGCMGSCLFCSISAFLKKQQSVKWRGRSIENIIDELKLLQNQGATTIKFVDDSFLENERDERWCEKFKNSIKENSINMKFRASIRADKVTKKNIKMLHKAGFFSFSCGIENGSPTALKRMAKRASVQDNKKALAIFKKNKIYVQAGFILFDNKTTLMELNENYKFLKKYKWLISKGIFSEMFAASGTIFTKQLSSNSKSIASNYAYIVENEESRKVYTYLKKWQARHSKVYDMVIDPISAPKDLDIREMKKYHTLMVKMKKIDLKFMKMCLDFAHSNKDFELLYKFFCQKYDRQFNNIRDVVSKFYERDLLVYDADINGFLSSNTNIKD